MIDRIIKACPNCNKSLNKSHYLLEFRGGQCPNCQSNLKSEFPWLFYKAIASWLISIIFLIIITLPVGFHTYAMLFFSLPLSLIYQLRTFEIDDG
jgi:uncharacterized paraquat-inducible protein A